MDIKEQKSHLEVDKMIEEIIHLRKKNSWFEIMTAVGLVTAGMAIYKYFLV